ncbi:MAG: methyltransferase [Bdellovibrionaceae bacterium]|nr:methyltransferase [Pseudobdellovibrionaceae bacterium]
MADYKKIYQHYEECFKIQGDNHRGVDWPVEKDVNLRHKVMTELFIKDYPTKILDFGCGLGHYLDYLKGVSLLGELEYFGADISEPFIKQCQVKYPHSKFAQIDILKDNVPFSFDYAVCNGVFTVKKDLQYEVMWQFMVDVISKLYSQSNKGIAFNVMSKNVDWERDDLFHVSLDQLTQYLCKNLSRHFVVRSDYGLYEYTVYVYKTPRGVE